MPRTILTEEIVFREYVMNGKSDRQIAEKYGCDRTAVVHRRKRMGITSRVATDTGKIGEQLVRMELRRLGFKVKDMNKLESGTHPFDLLVNDRIRIEVKAARIYGGRFSFQLSQKPNAGITDQSDYYVRLPCGRFRKDFKKTCDAIVFCCIANSVKFYVFPPQALDQVKSTINISTKPRSKWSEWESRWDLIMKKAA